MNRTFDNAFAPRLFKEIHLSFEAFVTKEHEGLLNNPHLQHVQVVTFPKNKEFWQKYLHHGHRLLLSKDDGMAKTRLTLRDVLSIIAVAEGLIREMPRLTVLQ